MTTAAATEADEAALAAQALADQDNADKQPTPDELWAQAHETRSTQAEGEPDDPLSGLPEPTRKLIEQIQAKTAEQDEALKTVGQKLATAHGTIGSLTQKLNASLQEITRIKPAIDAADAASKAEQEAENARKLARRKELEESMAELPEVKEYLDMQIADAKPAAEPVKAKPAEAEPTPEQREAQLIAERELSDRHPKWIETVRSPEFKNWKDKQPEAVKALGASTDVSDADKLITMFKKDQEDAAKIAKVEADRQARLRRNENVEGKGSAQKTGDESPDALWNKAKRAREKARAQT